MLYDWTEHLFIACHVFWLIWAHVHCLWYFLIDLSTCPLPVMLFWLIWAHVHYLWCFLIDLRTCSAMAWYVVHVGKEPRVYSSWAEAHAQVDGFKGNCYKKYKTRNEALLAFYGDQPENPPLLQPVSAPLLENDGNGNFRLCHSSFILVIAVVIALLVGFFIWKLM